MPTKKRYIENDHERYIESHLFFSLSMLRDFSMTFLNLSSYGMGWRRQVGLLPISKLLDGKPPGRVSDRAAGQGPFCMDNSRPEKHHMESVYDMPVYADVYGRLKISKSSHGIVCVQSSFLLFLLWVWVNTYGGDAQLFQVQGFDPKPYYIMITIL